MAEGEEFPTTKSRSASPGSGDPDAPKLSRKREREISLEPSVTSNGEVVDPKVRKDSLVPMKKNRLSLDSHVEDAEERSRSRTPSPSGSPAGSPKSPPQEVKMRVRQISQGVEDMNWQQIKKSQKKLPEPIETDDAEQDQEPERGGRRKLIERNITHNDAQTQVGSDPSKESQKRPRDDPDKDENPRETKRPTPPPDAANLPPKPHPSRNRAKSPPPSPKRQSAKPSKPVSSGFSAYSGVKSPFSKVKGPPVFGKTSSPGATFTPPATSAPATSPFRLSPSPNVSIPPTAETTPAATPAKPSSGFGAFAGSSSPFAALARSKSPIIGIGSITASPFASFASGGVKAFSEPSSSKPDTPEPNAATDEDDDNGETKTKKVGSFGDKLRASKDEEEEESKTSKPVLTEQELETGEEDENTVHQVRGKLFTLLDGQWKERGTGQLKLNVSNDGSSARLVMRKEAVFTILLNTTLFPGMKCSNLQDPRYLRFSAIEDGTTVHYNLKVSNAKIAKELLESIDLHTPSISSS